MCHILSVQIAKAGHDEQREPQRAVLAERHGVFHDLRALGRRQILRGHAEPQQREAGPDTERKTDEMKDQKQVLHVESRAYHRVPGEGR